MKRFRKIEDLTYNQLKELADHFHLKEYTKHKGQKKLQDFIKESVPHHELHAHLNPGWWKRNFNNAGTWASIISGLITVILIFWQPGCDKEKETTALPQVVGFKPIFPTNDSTHFNILILRFEDYITHEDTECIGRSIQEHLNDIQVNDPPILPLEIRYADSIPPPATPKEAIGIQKKHHADLIIYGLANNVKEDCAGADVCFRYGISEEVVAQIAPVIEVKTIQHELDYQTTSPFELQKGKFQIDALSLKYWIKSLVNVKVGNEEAAFLDLDRIGGDTSLSKEEKANRYDNIGITYIDLKQFDNALNAFNKALELISNNATYYSHIGIVHSNLNKYQLAIEDFDQAIQLDPDYAIAFNNRGSAYSDLDQHQRAIEDYDRAIQLNPELAFAFNNRGSAYSDLDQHQRAIEDYDRAIQLDPELAIAFNNRGSAYSNLDQHQRAIEDYDRAIQLNPEHSSAFNNRGSAYSDLNQHQRAIEDYDRAIQLNPEHAIAFNNRGIIYYNLKQYQRAIEDYDRAMQLDPKMADAFNNRGIIYYNLKQYQRAIEDYGVAIKLNPKFTNAYYGRGRTYSILKKYKLAITDFDNVILFDSKNVQTFTIRGIAYYYLKDYKKAILDFNTTISLSPNHAAAHCYRANAYRGKREFQRAKADIQKSISLYDKDGAAYAILAMIYADEGNSELFYQNMEIAISKPLAYPLKEKLEEEETLQKFKREQRFKALLDRSKE